MVKTTCVWLKEQRERLFVFSVALDAFSITTDLISFKSEPGAKSSQVQSRPNPALSIGSYEQSLKQQLKRACQDANLSEMPLSVPATPQRPIMTTGSQCHTSMRQFQFPQVLPH